MTHLYGLCYSPWTVKARWALDHHKIPYRYHEHLLLFGMPALRWHLRKPFGDVTVPALVSGKIRIIDSFEIARYAESIGSGPPLFPSDRLEEIREINRLSEVALDCSRAFTSFRILKEPEAQMEVLPAFIPSILRRGLRFLTYLGGWYIEKEFKIRRKTLKAYEEDYRLVLEEFRRRLHGEGGSYLLGHFTYADIAAALALQGVEPVRHPTLPLGEAFRRAWTHPALSAKYKDLLTWRDEIFRKHR